MRKRLLFAFIIFAFVAIAALEIPLGNAMSQRNRQDAFNQLQSASSSLGLVISSELESKGHVLQLLEQYQRQTGNYVVVLNGDTIQFSSGREATEEVYDKGVLGLLPKAEKGSFVISMSDSDRDGNYLYSFVPLEQIAKIGLHQVLIVAESSSVLNNTIDHDWLLLFGIGIFVLIVAIVAGIIISQSFSGPIVAIRDGVKLIGQGDISYRLREIKGPKEIKDLSKSVNQMADQIDDLIKAQTEFIADASHQLRSPLTALRLRYENLVRQSRDCDANVLFAVGEELDRLTFLVDELLVLARFDTVVRTVQSIDLVAVIEKQVLLWTALCEEKNIHLTFHTEVSDRPFVRAGPGEIEQIFDNLISNAINVSPPDSVISVSIDYPWSAESPLLQDTVELHIKDNGPGMTAEDLEMAFRRFWRGSDTSYQGSGLGLSVVAKLARQIGAVCRLDSPPGKGLDAIVIFDVVDGNLPDYQSHSNVVDGEKSEAGKVNLVRKISAYFKH
ncbi:MAG: HAMP domain-containing histidine kinase [Firmicutes bacterium]|nr:HAMP domain-containing histidine kinase [Bacillota bacterium]